MAPTRSKKRKSTESDSSMDVPSFPAPPSQLALTEPHDAARTPTGRSPIKKAPMRITLNQKQALIDNLQLEVTERARKLRAQYAMQAQGLRTRIEIRVNRIPMALRRANMAELFAKHNEASKQGSAPPNPSTIVRSMMASPKNLIRESQSIARHGPSPMRGAKRLSDEIADKENDDLSNPRKRAKAPIPARPNSRAKLEPDKVLSPRSANSRTLPRSPARPIPTPAKSYMARPTSPLKPMAPTTAAGAAGILTGMVEKAKSTRATSARTVTASSSGSSTAAATRGRKAPKPAPVRKAGKPRTSNGSQSSDASSGTTVMTKAAAAKSPEKRTVMNTIKGMGATAAKKPVSAKAAAPTRVLRKRNYG